MSVISAERQAETRARAADRLRLIDQLAAVPVTPTGSCGELFTAVDASGQLTGIAGCEHWAGEPGSLELAWGAARRFTLLPSIAGPEVAQALDQLISQWRTHLRQVPETSGDDTGALVHWPSRDIAGLGTMLDHGLVPLTVLAARAAGEHQEPAVPPGVSVRRAQLADLDAVARLAVEEIEFDAHFGCVVLRADALASMRDYVAPLLAEPEPWTWIAERDGTPAGILLAEPPAATSWISPMTTLSSASYLTSMYVRPTERGNGLGSVLTASYHRESVRSGVQATLLHYEQFNPLSVPFWSRHGYRPLSVALEARPARSLR